VPRNTLLAVNLQTVSGEEVAYVGNPTALNNGDVLTYVLARSRWENAPAGAASIKTQFYETEFLDYFATSPALFDPWFLVSPQDGTVSKIAGLALHPGIIRFSSTTSADSGYMALTQIDGILIAGGEQANFIIRPQVLAGTTIRLGFHDSSSSAAPVDGCYIEMAQVAAVDGVIVGKTSSNSVRSTTVSNYTLVTDTWYQLRVAVNAAVNLVSYYLYNEAGVQLWTDTLAANIPVAAGREVGHGIVATNSATSAVALVDVDYMNLWIDRNLTRL